MNVVSPEKQNSQELIEDSTQTFILRSLDGSQRVIEDVEVELEKNHQGQDSQGLVIAIFNKDFKPYTPTFIDSSWQVIKQLEQNGFAQKDLLYKNYFETKVKSSQGQNLNQVAGKKSFKDTFQGPSSQYCLICSESFQNYFKHINHPIHIKKINQSIGKQYIDEIVHHIEEQTWKRNRIYRSSNSKIKKQKRQQSLHYKTKGQENMQQLLNFQQKLQLPIKKDYST